MEKEDNYKSSEVRTKILEEDDCAPDAREYFKSAFLKEVGMNLAQFKSSAKVITDLGDTMVYENDEYELRDEIGIHTLFRKKQR